MRDDDLISPPGSTRSGTDLRGCLAANSDGDLSITRASAGCAVVLVAFIGLAWLGRSPPVNAYAFAVSMIAAWLGYALLFSRSGSASAVFKLAVACAIAVRIAGLLTPPIYEDDWARYLWDGLRFLQDGTPYRAPPSSFFEDASLEESWRAVLSQVNNPEVPTIYGPALQYVFAFSSWFAPANLTGLKAVLIAFDLGLWALIARLGGGMAGLRYALCPLVIFEVSFNAHADIVGAALVVACYALLRSNRHFASGVVFGLALACKPFAIIVAPCFLNRRWYLTLLGAAAALIALYAPFVLDGATEYGGLQAFSRFWEFNSIGFAALKSALGDSPARMLAAVLGGGLAGALALRWWLTERRAVPPADTWLLALLFFAPVVNPWYLLWAVPWACLRPNALTWAVLPAVSLSYLTVGILGFEGPSFYDHPLWVRPLEILAAAAIYYSLRRRERALLAKACSAAEQNLGEALSRACVIERHLALSRLIRFR